MTNFKNFTLVMLAFLIPMAAGLTTVNDEEIDLFPEDVELHSGQTVDWTGHEFSYRSGEGYSRDILTVTDSKGVLVEQFSGDELYKLFKEAKKVDENLYFRIKKLDREDQELEMTVWTNEEEFGSSQINVSAPEYIVKQSGESFTIPLTVENTGGISEA